MEFPVVTLQIMQLIVQLSKELLSRRLCYAVGDTDRAVYYVGPRFKLSSERLGEWSLYTNLLPQKNVTLLGFEPWLANCQSNALPLS